MSPPLLLPRRLPVAARARPHRAWRFVARYPPHPARHGQPSRPSRTSRAALEQQAPEPASQAMRHAQVRGSRVLQRLECQESGAACWGTQRARVALDILEPARAPLSEARPAQSKPGPRSPLCAYGAHGIAPPLARLVTHTTPRPAAWP
eukprot:scaffold113980_cov24-Tisochrysis_lutea.AAC.2